MSNNKNSGFGGMLKSAGPIPYIIAGLVIWGILMAVFFLRSGDSEGAASQQTSATNSSASANPSPSPIPPTIARPLNGEVLTVRETDEGLHKLVIANNGETDAIVKLVDAKTGKTSRHSYVWAKRDLDINHIRDGAFIIKFSFGLDYSPSLGKFTKEASYMQFANSTIFASVIKNNNIYGDVKGFTLFPKKGGNVIALKISEEDFADK